MLKNYFKVAIRNLLRHKAYSLINILGLSIGLTCCLLLFIYVQDELSYDKFHTKSERIYRLKYEINGFNLARSPLPIAPNLVSFFPEVEKAARMYNRDASVEIVDQAGNKKQFEEGRIFFADSSIQDIFTFEYVAGDPASMLRNPFSVVLTDEVAEKYFGNENAIGKTIYLAGNHPFNVTGIIKDFPSASHVHFSMIAPFDNLFDIEQGNGQELKQRLNQNWVASHLYTYALLKEGESAETANARFEAFYDKFVPENLKLGQKWSFFPMSDTRLYANLAADPEPVSSITFVYIFSAIAILTLLIACINFINLSTAKSLQRTKEIGMRKVLGAWKTQLVIQFLGESLVVSLVAAFIACGLSFYLLPALNTLTDKELLFGDFITASNALMFLALVVTTAIAAGLYPAFFVTKIDPANSLKGILSNKGKAGLSFRKVLVIVQFTVSIILISGGIIVYQQVNFMRNRPMGFEKDFIINVPLFSNNFNNAFGGVEGDMRQRMNTFEDEMMRSPNVLASTLSDNPLGLGSVYRPVVPDGHTREENIIAPVLSVDYDFIDTYGLNVVTGRAFDKSFGTDHLNAVLVNESAVKDYGFGSNEEAIGKKFTVEGNDCQVVGVIKDFHFMTLQQPIGPLVFRVSVANFTMFSIKVHQQNLPATIAGIEEIWTRHFPEKAFEYSFLDETLASSYRNEERLGKIVGYFAGIAILISCLGSYGLIMFLAQQKMKEISIRKVLGATIGNIILLLSKGFALLVLLSLLIAVPVVYYFMDGWLSDFSFRINIGPGSFLLAGGLTLLIVGLTISYQAIKAAYSNPVSTLRNE
ncbi:ABC transporter permease [Imperialibacter roseus]|uniref:ABC transporter permease n=1 Tax=Imperialibacter roseus TaxID=1324217 RepID=A0ABZ0ITG1_9BACT|nr:ABC transporter permease [Imperialibacter roseus]WOK08310.1 ABC transporter permease [Imperialibacter roseus]